MTELRIYEYRIYPSRIQVNKIYRQFSVLKEAYNSLLEISKEDLITSRSDMYLVLRDIKTIEKEKYSIIYAQSLQNVADRLSKSYSNFFNGCKTRRKGIKIKIGYPRFKSRIQSITYPQLGFKLLSDKKIKVSKIGCIPIKLHRIPKGKIKTMTIKQNKASQWYVYFACEMPEIKVKHPHPKTKIGIDVGLERYATTNTSQVVDNPKFLRHNEERLSRLQRRHSRTIKGSKNCEKARIKLARCHFHIRNKRRDFLHKISTTLTRENYHIKAEKLQIQNMVKNHCLAKSINDAGWGIFFQMLSYKAVTSGGKFERVNSKNTSKECSGCKATVEMPLKKRIFDCPKCGLKIHRDHNASINIRNKNTVGLTEINACGN